MDSEVCGRYSLYDYDEIGEHFEVEVPESIRPNYNVAPTQLMPVIRSDGKHNSLEIMHWGIPRVLGKDIVKELINTRADKAFGRFWKKQVTQHRCLVPANSFYEWKMTSAGKTPFLIKPKDRDLFAFAGIWNEWTDDSGKSFNAYSIMTTNPNKEMKAVHDRMPVILSVEQESIWLNDDTDESLLEELLIGPADNSLTMYEVSKNVNVVKINDGSLILPINSK